MLIDGNVFDMDEFVIVMVLVDIVYFNVGGIDLVVQMKSILVVMV